MNGNDSMASSRSMKNLGGEAAMELTTKAALRICRRQ